MKGSFTNLNIGTGDNYIIDCLSSSKPVYLYSDGIFKDYETGVESPVSKYLVNNMNVYYNVYGVHGIYEYDDRVLVTGSYNLLQKGFLQAYMLAENTITVFREFEGWDKLPKVRANGKMYRQVTNEVVGEAGGINKILNMFNSSILADTSSGLAVEGFQNYDNVGYVSPNLNDVNVLTWRGPVVEGGFYKCLDTHIPVEEITNSIKKVGDRFLKDGVFISTELIRTGLRYTTFYRNRTFNTDIPATSILYANGVLFGKETK